MVYHDQKEPEVSKDHTSLLWYLYVYIVDVYLISHSRASSKEFNANLKRPNYGISVIINTK